MHTLPSNRTVNTFQPPPSPHSSVIGLPRYSRPNSMHFVRSGLEDSRTEEDESVRSHLLSPGSGDTQAVKRRAQTLGRSHTPHLSAVAGHNLTNPLFDSLGSLDQPWYRSSGNLTALHPPKINLQPMHPREEISHYRPASEIVEPLRLPATGSPARVSEYSSRPRTHQTTPKQGCGPGYACLPCFGCGNQVQSTTAPDLVSRASEVSAEDRRARSSDPWVICVLTLSVIGDLFLLLVMAVLIVFLNCSSDGWLYSNRQVKDICSSLWTNWVPLHYRSFGCPSLPPGYEQSYRPRSETLPYIEGGVPYEDDKQRLPNNRWWVEESASSRRSNQMGSTANGWDADLGLMPPPSLQSPNEPKETRVYAPDGSSTVITTGPEGQRIRWRLQTPYPNLATNTVIVFCLIVPSLLIVSVELVVSCLSCCQVPLGRGDTYRSFRLRRIIGRFHRFIGNYIFGLLTVILLTLILKVCIGRLRPDFVSVCRPSARVCPRWASLLQQAGWNNEQPTSGYSHSRLSFLAEESAKLGYYLVTTTPAPGIRRTDGSSSLGTQVDPDCLERDILKMKTARTSFPSLGAAVTTYSSLFVTIYLAHRLRYLRNTCFCIPIGLLFGACLVNVFIGLGRVTHRENWLGDVLAGWGLGATVCIFMLFRSISGQAKVKDVSNLQLNRQIRQLQLMVLKNNEYKQNEVRLMKYM